MKTAKRANFLADHRYASDFIEGIRSHHEDAKSTKLKDRKIFFRGGFQTRPNHTLRERVLLSLKVFAARANFPVVIQTISVQKKIHRGDTEYAEKKFYEAKLRTSCSLCLCGEFFLCSFGCGFAALGPSWLTHLFIWLRLCRAVCFVDENTLAAGTYCRRRQRWKTSSISLTSWDR
jgi:hypothetical protein